MWFRGKLDSMTEEQRLRFEFFIRSHFSRSHIKEIMSRSMKGAERVELNEEMVISVAGLAKLFVGEIIDRSMDVMEVDNAIQQEKSEKQVATSLKPRHIRYFL